MCNLYSIRKSREEVIGLFNISRVGNDIQLSLPAIYPDSMALVIKLDRQGAFRNMLEFASATMALRDS